MGDGVSGFTLSAIRKAIKAQLLVKIEGRQVNVYEYPVGKPVAPYIELIMAQTPDYYMSFGASGIASVQFLVRIVPGNVDESAAIRLDDLLSIGVGNQASVIDALKSDPTFGGVANTFEVEPGEYDAVNVTADLVVTIHVSKQGANA